MRILLIVWLTVYHATPQQCNADCLTTANGKKIESTETAYKHRYMAVSRDLLETYPYGTEVEVSGCSIEEYNGIWTVQDTMNKRIKNTVDLLINPGMKLTSEEVEIRKVETEE